jgi:hypothetical protein
MTFANCRAASAWSVPSHASMLTGRLPHDHAVHARSPGFDALDPDETFLDDLPDHRSIGVSANVYASSAFGFDTLFEEFLDVSRDQRYPTGLDLVKFIDDHPDADPSLGRYADLLGAIATHDRPLASLGNAAWLAGDGFAREGPFSLPTPVDDGARTVTRALESRIGNGSEPVIAFANLMEAHEPHRGTWEYDCSRYRGTVPRGWSSRGLKAWDVMADPEAHAEATARYRALYGASIEYLDRVVSGFIDRLLDTTDRETAVVLTADHGENLALPADEGGFGHVTSLSEGVLHVPLLLVNPPAGYPERIDGLASHLDLRQLVVGLARGESPQITAGEGCAAAEVIGITPSNEPLLEQDPDRWDRLVRCVYEDERKHVWDSRGEYSEYVIDPDRPCWQRRVGAGTGGNRSDSPPAWAAELFATGASEYRRSVDARTGDVDSAEDTIEVDDAGNKHDDGLDPRVARRID